MLRDEIYQWLQDLKKSTHPDDFQKIDQETDHELGSKIVDYTSHLKDIPESVKPERGNFSINVTNHPDTVRSRGSVVSGISPKTVFDIRDQEYGKLHRHMVKPYFEKVSRAEFPYQHSPMAGWSEMANQDIWHAAGLGDEHQKVHVAELNHSGQPVPHLVVTMNPAAVELDSMMPSEHPESEKTIHTSEAQRAFAEQHYQRAHAAFLQMSPEAQEAARKKVALDFLTNGLDSHVSNCMYNKKTGKLLSIDHGRSFQYLRNPANKWTPDHIHAQDLNPHDALEYYYQPHLGQKDDDKENSKLAQTVKNWWPQVSERINDAMEKHLSYIKDPRIREHTRKNFQARKEYLDNLCEFPDIFTIGDIIPMHRPKFLKPKKVKPVEEIQKEFPEAL